MAILGKGAMILSFDIAPEAIVEHDDWHSHEHFPERLILPGFLRGSRWTAVAAGKKYFVMYEVDEPAVLVSKAYMDRLNTPTPWTARIMTFYRGMKRGLCRLVGSFGYGHGSFALLIYFSATPERKIALQDWLLREVMPDLPAQSGLANTHLFEAGVQAELAADQLIRGKDEGVDSVLLVTGYSRASVEALADKVLTISELERHGAEGVTSGIYQLVHSLTDREALLIPPADLPPPCPSPYVNSC